MAKKARNRRSGRVARQKERIDALQKKVDAGTATDEEKALLASLTEPEAAADEEPISEEEAELIAAANAVADEEGDDKPAKKSPRRKSALRRYLGGVRLEMRRVTWPTGSELARYSVSSIAMLLLTGAAVWAVDNAFIAGIIEFSKLRP